MKITKFLHSCLLFENHGQKILFDPGTFSFSEGDVNSEQFADISQLVVTHNHPDHLDMPAVKRILELSSARLICNSDVAERFKLENIDCDIFDEGERQYGTFKLKAIPVKHELILAEKIPPVTAYVVNGRVLHPVDSLQDSLKSYEGIELLILPIMAPFLTEVMAYEFVKKVMPKKVLPVHDGFAKEYFVKARHKNFDMFLEKLGIKFFSVYKAGESIDI